jgi:hypothetical protein
MSFLLLLLSMRIIRRISDLVNPRMRTRAAAPAFLVAAFVQEP